MPFQSTSQRAWMYANKPAMAARWARETPKDETLPKRVPKAAHRKALLAQMKG